MTISKSPSPYEISRPVIEISVNDIGVGYNSREIVYQRVFSILLFLFVPIFSISPYPSPPFIFCTLLDSSLRIKYTDTISIVYRCQYLSPWTQSICPYPIFSSTARKANEYERLTVPRYKSRRPRLVNRSRKERRGEKSRAEKREEERRGSR